MSDGGTLSIKKLIKSGTVVNASGSRAADVLIENGKVKKISDQIDGSGPDTQVIDATGLYVLPGGVDAHVHMELPVGGGFIHPMIFFPAVEPLSLGARLRSSILSLLKEDSPF